ncbi:YceD family protein [Panacagrimonas sp.]|uniref:YceD family protein n=1 Tax=Panacagrimonas sp. TaxID=2480088 RepID=UPI003B51D28F
MPIPAQVSAERALARHERYQGELDPAGFERLRDAVSQTVYADLQIRRDVAGVGWVEGLIRAQLTLECRVCTASFVWPLDTRFALALARDEQEEARLMERAEPLLLMDDELRLHEIVEDELLLALPMMPKCATCENARPPEPSAAAAEDTRRPFAALKELGLKDGSAVRRK